MWMRPEFQELRNCVDTASSNPLAFPKNISTSVIVHDSRENASMSSEFVQKIESGSARNRNDIDHDPVLEITDASTKFRKFTLNSCEHAHE